MDTTRMMIKDDKKVLEFRIPRGLSWRGIGGMKHGMGAEKYIQGMLTSEQSAKGCS